MKIERNMDLGALAELMGPEATREEAAIMHEFLLAGVDTCDETADIPESVWIDCLNAVVESMNIRSIQS